MARTSKSVMTAAVVAASFAAFSGPVAADKLSGLPPIILQTDPAPQVVPGVVIPAEVAPLGPQIVLPIPLPTVVPYPSCPSGFGLSHKDPSIFHCRINMQAAGGAIAFAQAKGNASCGSSSYWTSGPELTVELSGSTLYGHFRCRRS